MHLQYRTMKGRVMSQHRKSGHVSPHLHDALEIVYITKGTLEAGVGAELYHMEEEDMALIFPNIIHHYQVFSGTESRAYYIQAPSSRCGAFTDKMQKYCPKNPIIKGSEIGKDVKNALRELSFAKEDDIIVAQAYVQIILAKCLPRMELTSKAHMQNNSLIYHVAVYIEEHFREEISLETMASDTGINKYALSRIFSRDFHCNFNRYLNEIRLNYACACLENTDCSITEIWLDSGFDSQRTFNRVFRERYRMTPREYRSKCFDSFG